MIEEKAIVVAVEGEKVLLQTQRRSTCQSCSVKQGCGTSVLAKVIGQRSSQISIENTLSADVGDEVMIGVNDNALVKGSLLVYAMPLLFLLIGALSGELFAHTYNLNAELMAIMAGLVGFVLAIFFIRYGLSRSALNYEIQPQMLRIVHRARDKRDILMAP